MIFEDPSKKRWKRTMLVFWAAAGISLVLTGVSIYSFFVYSPIPDLSKASTYKGTAFNKLIQEIEGQPSGKPKKAGREKADRREQLLIKEVKREKVLKPFTNSSFARAAFLIQDDPESVKDLKRHINELELVFPDWFSFNGKDAEINETVQADVMDYLKKHKAEVFATITNFDKESNRWAGEEVSSYIHGEQNRSRLCRLIANTLDKYGLKGVNIDFEALDSSSKDDYLDFLYELRSLLHKDGRYLTVDIPVNDEAYDYEAIGDIADFAVVMAYDEHYAGGESGPIAARDWFDDCIDTALQSLPPQKVIISLGQYGYDWDITSKAPAASLSFDEAMVLANEVGADIETDKEAVNSGFSYRDRNGDEHRVWFLDGVSLWNEIQALEEKGACGIALWRLGLEDPSIWSFYPPDKVKAFKPEDLSKVYTLDSINYDGTGEILRILAGPKEGKRSISLEGSHIDYASYDVLPTSYEVQRFGHNDRQDIALTFDDGPDPVYTPQILDVLKQYGVKATFFLVGDQAQKNIGLVEREVREGHILGNHTYYHPNVTKIPSTRLELELNAVQRLIESLTGKQTLIFRAPYDTDTSPSSDEQMAPLYTAGKMGYIVVGADIDSMDYDRPGTDKIVQNVVSQLESSNSNIIVMHDAGGNRTQTVAALKKLIPLLQSKGYNFVNVNDLMGVPESAIMPSISLKERLIVWSDRAWAFAKTWGWSLIVVLFFLSTLISVFRILFLGFFVQKTRRKGEISHGGKAFRPFVSVIVPAYNEEKVIEKTINALQKSRYDNFEILVVDDGSKDGTADIVRRLADGNGRLRLIQKANGGKASALNLGFGEARGEYVITIDADTIVLPDTIEHLTAPFEDGTVDAVCGNVKVGNINNIITGFQAVEYITTQNYDRRAFDSLNCISVVPGATGAWRKSKVIEAGGYSDITLTEDADLTLTMLEKGARIVYAPSARSVTEAPEGLRALFKQRFRWSYGTFQCLWKHRRSFFKGSLGRVALPNMLIFQIIFPVLSPIGDAVFLLSLFRGDMKAILAGYLLFLIMDFAASTIAFSIEGTPKKYLLFILIQRFFYRQFMYLVTFKSLIAAVKGGRHGWNKLQRNNSVNVKAAAVE